MSADLPAEDAPCDPVALVRQARERGTPLLDPMRWAVLEALARRTAMQQGLARQGLEQRLRRLLAEPAACTAGAPHAPPAPFVARPSDALLTLSQLVDTLGRARQRAGPSDAEPVPLRAIGHFRHTWARLRAEERLRQARSEVPAQAGPLNSSQVLHRTLQAMHTLSPAYLEAFMAHVDSLLALEQASGGGALPLNRQTAPATARSAGRR